MISILFFIPRLSAGGAEKVLCNLVNNMDLTKFDITVQTLFRCDPEKYLLEKIHYKYIFPECRGLINKIINLWYRICTEIKLTYPLYVKGDYDIEVAYLECDATKVMAGSTNDKARKIAWVHCDVRNKGLTLENVGMYYKLYDRVICVSKAAQKSFNEVFSECIEAEMLYNVIDETEIIEKSKVPFDENWQSNSFHILVVGRLSFEKGVDRLIDVCKRLKSDGCSFKIHLLGDGPMRENLQDEVKTLNLSDYIEFEGFTDNPYRYMSKADLILIPSRSEALSTVVIESLILGKAIVTTLCPGMEELLGNSEYGVIVENSDEGIYKGVKLMIENREIANAYSKKASVRGKDFYKHNMISKIENFFKEEVEKA